jgi:hypothetical protein
MAHYSVTGAVRMACRGLSGQPLIHLCRSALLLLYLQHKASCT